MSVGLEDIEHIKLMDWARSREDIEPFIFHFANQRRCSVQEGRKLKRMGVKRGVSDFFVCCPRGGFAGLWIELKAGDGKPTKEQLDFINLMGSQGYLAMWRVGYESARLEIENYIAMKSPVVYHPGFYCRD